MKRKRYTDEQIAFALRQAESGTQVPEIIRKKGSRISSVDTITEECLYPQQRREMERVSQLLIFPP